METGYYWVKHHGKIIPARWDGKYWHHSGQTHETDHKVISALDPPICPPGCICTKQPDGSWDVEC